MDLSIAEKLDGGSIVRCEGRWDFAGLVFSRGVFNRQDWLFENGFATLKSRIP